MPTTGTQDPLFQQPVSLWLTYKQVNNRAVYTRENKLRLTLAAAYVSRQRNYLYEYKLPGQDKPRLEKAVNVDFEPFIRGVRGLRKPRPELAAAYFLSYKRPYYLLYSVLACCIAEVSPPHNVYINKLLFTGCQVGKMVRK